MKTRIKTGAIIFTVLLAIFAGRIFLQSPLNVYMLDAVIAMFAVVATAEVSRVFNRSGRANHMNVAVYYSVLVYLSLMWGINSGYRFSEHLLLQSVLLVVMFSFSFCISYFNKQKLNNNENFKASKLSYYKYSMQKAGLTTFIMVYPALIISFMYLLNHIKDLGFDLTTSAYSGVDLGVLLLVLTFVVTMITDTFAYFVGSKVGGPKLAPLISPKKTISGSIGGIVGAILFSALIFTIFNTTSTTWQLNFNLAFNQAEINIWYFVIYGFLASVVGQIGDLFASKVKRVARAKDFSTIFPGHGGFMDRLDGISFNAVLTFIFAVIFFL